jgi:hypothetical protein
MPSGEGGEAKCMMSRTRYVPQDPVHYVETASLTMSDEESLLHSFPRLGYDSGLKTRATRISVCQSSFSAHDLGCSISAKTPILYAVSEKSGRTLRAQAIRANTWP